MGLGSIRRVTFLIAGAVLIPACSPNPTSTPPPPAPTTPTAFSASAKSSNEIDLTWLNGINPQTGVSIERSPDDVTFDTIATLGAAATSYQDTTLLPSTTYYYRIDALNG